MPNLPTRRTSDLIASILNPQTVRVSPQDITGMDVLDANGRVKLMPAAEWRKFPHQYIQQWCHVNSRYVIPTIELINWLKQKIGGRTAIEVGAGMGDLGYHLGIQMTDSYMQRRPEVQLYYQTLGSPTTDPPPDVAEYEALDALDHFKPQVCVAGFLTQMYQDGDSEKRIGSSVYGAQEFRLLEKVETYIMIGNELPHYGKRLLNVPHETYKVPWVVTRAKEQDKNVIWVWNRA